MIYYYWYIESIQSSISIEITGITQFWDWIVISLYIIVLIGVPIILVGMVYFDNKRYQKLIHPELFETRFQGEYTICDPLTVRPESMLSR